MQTVRTLEELEKRLVDAVRGPGRATTILGGHYPINIRGQAETSADDSFGIFPEYTFELASRLVAEGRKNRSVKIALLVDDHSLLRPSNWYASPEATDNRATSEMIRAYFDRFSLPANYRAIMGDHSLTESDFIRASTHQLPFQESALRIQGGRDGVPATCSGEYGYFLSSLRERGIGRVISLIPSRCQGPTCQAAGIASSQAHPLKLTQVYLPSDSTIASREELQESISEKGVPFVTFG